MGLLSEKIVMRTHKRVLSYNKILLLLFTNKTELDQVYLTDLHKSQQSKDGRI